jgi:hypothetical protein
MKGPVQLATRRKDITATTTSTTAVHPAAALLYNPEGRDDYVTADNTGWAATAAYPSITARTCALFQGSVSPPAPATVEGVVACTP